MRTHIEQHLTTHFRHNSLSEYLKLKSDQLQIANAINHPRMHMAKNSLMAINLAEKTAASLQWLWQYKTTIMLASASAMLTDSLYFGIAPWMITSLASVAASYIYPATAVATLAVASYKIYKDVLCFDDLHIGLEPEPTQLSYVQQIKRLEVKAVRHATNAWLSLSTGCDQAALKTAAIIASSFAPESPGLWPGWVSWILSLLGGSHPSADIMNSKTRLLLDHIEKKITVDGIGIGTLIHCLKLIKQNKEEIRYHTNGTVNQFSSRLYALLSKLSQQMQQVNQVIKTIFIHLDTIEEQLLLKPGLLTQPFQQLVTELYDHCYFMGYTFATLPSENGQRIYRETPPFTESRQQHALTRQQQLKPEERVAAYNEDSRFSTSNISRARRMLVILNGESISYCRMMATRFNSKVSIYKLIRVAALINGEHESEYLWLYKRGENTLSFYIDRIQATMPQVIATPSYDAAKNPAFDTEQDLSLEAYFLRSSTQRKMDTASLDETGALTKLYTLQKESTDFYYNIYQRFFDLFGDGGKLDKLGNDLSNQGRRQLALLRGEADRIFNNHQLHPLERITLILSLTKRYFPLGAVDEYLEDSNASNRRQLSSDLQFLYIILSDPIFYKNTYDLFSSGGSLANHSHVDIKHRADIVRDVMSYIMQDNTLEYDQKTAQISHVIQSNFPIELAGFVAENGLSDYLNQLQYYRQPRASLTNSIPQGDVLNPLPITESLRARSDHNIPDSIAIYHFLRNHIQHEHGFLGQLLYEHNPAVNMSLQTMLNNVRDMAFSTKFDEAEKQKAICQLLFACHRQLSGFPYIQAHIMHTQHAFFEQALITSCQAEGNTIRERVFRRQQLLKTILHHPAVTSRSRATRSSRPSKTRLRRRNKHTDRYLFYGNTLPCGLLSSKAKLDELFTQTIDLYCTIHRRRNESRMLENLLDIRDSFFPTVPSSAHPAWDLIACVVNEIRDNHLRSDIVVAFKETCNAISHANTSEPGIAPSLA
ncbi:MAG: hypothetical protein P1U63_09985 [Coxiellaceae bacterium]|nr:hypothetical protein [Coxiellaceae bacterium]